MEQCDVKVLILNSISRFYWYVTTNFEKLQTLKKKIKVRQIWDQLNAFWKKNQNALNFEPFYALWKKSNCVGMLDVNALWKKMS